MKSTGLGGRPIASSEAWLAKHDLPYLKYRHLSETYVIEIYSNRRLFAAIVSQADCATISALDRASPRLVV
ncbi:hypothetical protein B5P46_20385 [Rhizobium leguminosarum]|uniref:Uncharacterized protein n=1 Tax=Rhizobium leguminosarum TaxID=384 RepID=A0A4Q1TYI2_RHILE|nr:hypothetical protein B5P46_20385 [Rhizobium leguminosarum]